MMVNQYQWWQISQGTSYVIMPTKTNVKLSHYGYTLGLNDICLLQFIDEYIVGR